MAKRTKYKGIEFRSRLEARWAVCFDEWKIRWEYEPEGFDLPNGMSYLPDFRLWFDDTNTRAPSPLWIEVKGLMTDDDRKKIRAFYNGGDNPIYVVGSIPAEPIYDFPEDDTYYNFATVNGDCFGARPGVRKRDGGFDLFGATRGHLDNMDKEATARGLAAGRNAKFEFGETPVPPRFSYYPNRAQSPFYLDMCMNAHYSAYCEALAYCSKKARDTPNYLQQYDLFDYAAAVDKSLRISLEGDVVVPYFNHIKEMEALQCYLPIRTYKWFGSRQPNFDTAHIIPGHGSGHIAVCEGLITGLNVHKRYCGNIPVHITGTTGKLSRYTEYLLEKTQLLHIKVIVDHTIRCYEGSGLNAKIATAEALKMTYPNRVTVEHIATPLPTKPKKRV